MKCYYHNESDAVGTCKSCGKGLCPECAADVGNGIACKNHCEKEVLAVNDIIERNKTAYQKIQGAYSRNALIYALMGGLFVLLGLGTFLKNLTFGLILAVMGIIMLVGAVVTYQAGKRFNEK